MNAKISDIWEKFCPLKEFVRDASDNDRECPDSILKEWSEMRNHIVAKYYEIVQKTAKQMARKITEVDEHVLVSMGVDGLYDAVDGFNLEENVKFETYAGPRIRGSILDAIRRDDWVPRLVRSRSKELKEKRQILVAQLGRTPTDEEMAAEMKMSVDDYVKMSEESNLKSMQSMNASFSSGGGDEGSANKEMAMVDCIHDRQTREPVDCLIADELRSKLFGKNFTPTERKIIHAYYYENHSMKEIAEQVGLSESRVSQMNSAIIQRLKDIIRRNPAYFGPQIMAMVKQRKTKAKRG